MMKQKFPCAFAPLRKDVGYWKHENKTPFILRSALDGRERLASRSSCLNHTKKSLWNPVNRRLNGIQNPAEYGEEDKLSSTNGVSNSGSQSPHKLSLESWSGLYLIQTHLLTDVSQILFLWIPVSWLWQMLSESGWIKQFKMWTNKAE